jgi:hypothetical protein
MNEVEDNDNVFPKGNELFSVLISLASVTIFDGIIIGVENIGPVVVYFHN